MVLSSMQGYSCKILDRTSFFYYYYYYTRTLAVLSPGPIRYKLYKYFSMQKNAQLCTRNQASGQFGKMDLRHWNILRLILNFFTDGKFNINYAWN